MMDFRLTKSYNTSRDEDAKAVQKPVEDDWLKNVNGEIKGQGYEYYLDLENTHWDENIQGTITRWYIKLNDVRDRFWDVHDKRIAYLTYTLTPEKQEWSVTMRIGNGSPDCKPVWGARFDSKDDACLYAIMQFNREKVYGITAYEISFPNPVPMDDDEDVQTHTWPAGVPYPKPIPCDSHGETTYNKGEDQFTVSYN